MEISTYKIINSFIKIVFVSSLFLFSCSAKAQSEIPVSKITISPQANYSKLKGGKQAEKLIDGKFAESNLFWLDPNTLGWQNYGRIAIDLELKEKTYLTSISLNTAKNESADVFLPLNVNVFTSLDGKNYSYLTDMSVRQVNKDNLYKVVSLKHDNINLDAKYIRLIIIPQGRMFFTDEITVYGKAKGRNSAQAKIISNSDIETIINKNKQTEINRTLLIDQIGRVDLKNEKIGLDLKSQILQATDLSTQESYQGYIQKISQLNNLRSIQKGFQIQFLTSPWSSLESNAVVNTSDLNIINAVNTTYYIAFQAINNQTKTLISNISVESSNKSIKIDKIYEAQDVRTRNSTLVKDALNSIDLDDKITFQKGERKVFILAVKSLRTGNSEIQLNFSGSNIPSLKLNINSIDIGLNEKYQSQLGFYVNVWPYYTFPFYKGKEDKIQQDLKDHYVNIFTIPPWVLEPLNIKTNHSKLKAYLEHYNAGDRVLLYLNQGSYIENPGDYLKDSWKRRYLQWHDLVMSILKNKGIKEEDIYLYPFDEIKERELKSFHEFTSWIRKVRPSSKIFVTVVKQSILPKVQPDADVYQLLVTKNQLDLVKEIKGKEYWIYDIMDDSKRLDPNSRYRLMAWLAFNSDATGIGFWNYGEMFGNSVWDDFDGQKADYNVVYDKGGNLIPSRRWEAFKQGIEDYFILSKYAEKFGHDATKKLIKALISSSPNSQEVEKFRTKMLKELEN